MKRVLKWNVPVDDRIHAIGGGPVVHVACQRGASSVQVWTESSESTPDDRTVQVFGTGMQLPENARHVGTTATTGFALVWHVYEVGE